MNRNFIITVALLLFSLTVSAQYTIDGELKKWHKVTITFTGPNAQEGGNPNPFLDYRLNVKFTNGNKTYTVPGYFAADGNAGETGANSGNKWRVHFAPDATGQWTFEASFRQGNNVAINLGANAGSATSFDGTSGSFNIQATNKSGRDHRAKGRLEYVGEHHLRFAETGEYFLKVGADAPENFLAYEGFDNTPNNGGRRKNWQPHVQDWNNGDPTWKGNKGKGIIGALNYLASEGQNAFSFLTMNIKGDDKNVFPYPSDSNGDRTTMDCSKLDQWEIVLAHADKLGMYLHFKTQETENDQLLDGGNLGTERKLYYRELVARFSHHLALNWNIGEENTNTDNQRKAFAQYFEDIDPYGHNIVIHTYPNQQDQVYNPLLGNATAYTGASIQTGWGNVHKSTLKWVEKSNQSGKKWVVANDEQGNANTGVPHDGYNGSPSQDQIRNTVLWGNLMAGGAGVEYYFGYQLPNSDLTCQDFRSRDRMWDYNRYAHQFFTKYIPYWKMSNFNNGIGNGNDNNDKYCLAEKGKNYLIYLGEGGSTNLNLENYNAPFQVRWYDPRNGGNLQRGSLDRIAGPGNVSIGNPPSNSNKDWVALITIDPVNCPAEGTPCDDGDPSTTNDMEDGNCGCEGEPCPTAGTACDDGNPNTDNDQEDGNCNCRGVDPNSPTDFWLEAECGNYGSKWTKGTDNGASRQAYLVGPNENSLNSAPTSNSDLVTFNVNVSQAGTYALFARTLTTNDSGDSFWVKVGNSNWIKWNKINASSYSNNFQWDQVGAWTSGESSTPVVFDLTPGLITISIAWREQGAKLDKLLLTLDGNKPSGTGGAASNCNENCPPAGTACDDGNPETANDREDGNCNCIGTPVAVVSDFWLEAECGEVGSKWTISTDPSASEDKYVAPPSRNALGSPSSNPADQVSFLVDIEKAGNYKLFGRTRTTSDNDDSFWVRVDGGEWINWNNINEGKYGNNYQWEQVSKWENGNGNNDGAFIERNGIVVIEMESASSVPGSWKLGPANNISSPNIQNPNGASGGKFLVWEGNQHLGNPGNGLITYKVKINTPGTYRFQWRNQVGRGTNTTEHNDTWLKIEGDAFYGEKGNGNRVCPKGYNSNQNDCSGNVPNGGGKNGWFKIYSSGANNWSWSTRTSDSDAHNIFARFDAPGTYNILISARSSSHVIDRMVMSRTNYNGNPQDLNLPESPRTGSGSGLKETVQFNLQRGEVKIEIVDREPGARLDKLFLTLSGNLPSNAGGEAINCENNPCQPAGTTCNDGDPNTKNDKWDGNCNCVGEPCPPKGTTCDDGNPNTMNDQWDGSCNCVGIACPPAGTACDDGDQSTTNDQYDGNCNCVGEPCPTAGTACDDGDPNTINDKEDGNCNCAGEPNGNIQTIWLEAECANVGSQWTVMQSNDASNSEYLVSPNKTSYNNAPSGINDFVTFAFTATENANYKIFARTITTNDGDDSFWLRVDNGSWNKWNMINAPNYADEFQWDQAGNWTGGSSSDPVTFNLSKGNHTIDISWREPGLRLDKLAVQVTAVAPTGRGGASAENCASCPPAGTACDDGDPTTINDQEDGFCNCTGTKPAGASEIWLEAECQQIGSKWRVRDDIKASQEQFVLPPSATSYNRPPMDPADHVVFSFNIQNAGTYHIFARSFNSNGGNDSYWVKVNDGDWLKWNRINAENYAPMFQWAKLGEWESGDFATPKTFELPTGLNTVTFSWREGGAKLDKLAILEVDEKPDGLGKVSEETCGDCPPSGTACDDGDPNTVNDQEDGNCNCQGSQPNSEDKTNFWMEAECASVGNNWNIMGSNLASGNTYTMAPNRKSLNSPPPTTDDYIIFNINLAEAGSYKVFVRAQTPNTNGNSLWVRVNGKKWIKWNKINAGKPGNEFNWDQVGLYNGGNVLPQEFALRKGANNIVIAWREALVAVDKVAVLPITEDYPRGMGMPDENCAALSQTSQLLQGLEEEQPVVIIDKLYPNPVSQRLYIQYSTQLNSIPVEEAYVEIVDLYGRRLSSNQKIINHFGEIIVDVEDLPRGAYILRINIAGQELIERFLKQ